MNLNELNLDDVPEVKSVERLSLEPKDTLVLTCREPLEIETLDRLRTTLESRFPGQKILVLSEVFDVKVIREE